MAVSCPFHVGSSFPSCPHTGTFNFSVKNANLSWWFRFFRFFCRTFHNLTDVILMSNSVGTDVVLYDDQNRWFYQTVFWFQTKESKPPCTKISIFIFFRFSFRMCSGFCGRHLNHWCTWKAKSMQNFGTFKKNSVFGNNYFFALLLLHKIIFFVF